VRVATSVLPPPSETSALVPGRGSVTWRVAGDVRVLGGAGYALLLQVAHPTVGAGVAEHSNFAADPWGRLLRTLDYVNGTIYGGPEMAAEIGRRVRAIHTSITGELPGGGRYHALEPTAYAWVHATLASSIVESHRRLGAPLNRREQEVFWEQWRRLGRLVGVRERDLPETWREFEPYFGRMVADQLRDTPMVAEVLRTLDRPVPPALPGLPPAAWRVLRAPLAQNLRLITIGLLPPLLRERFGLRWRAVDEARFRAVGAASRASGPLLVGPLRQFGPAYVRWRSAALARGDVAAPR
jgi:uncharacterized protein (DUF2236 family)